MDQIKAFYDIVDVEEKLKKALFLSRGELKHFPLFFDIISRECLNTK